MGESRAWVVAAGLVLGALAGCGSSPEGEDDGAAEDAAGGDEGSAEATPDVAPEAAEDAGEAEAEAEDVPADEAAEAEADMPEDAAEESDVPSLPPGLECVGTVVWPDPPTATYTYRYDVVELMTDADVGDVTVKICDNADPTCASPSAQGITDAAGGVSLTIPAGPQGLDGYVELSKTGYVTLVGFYSYRDNVAVYTTDGGLDYYILSEAMMSALRGMLGVTVDPARGIVLATLLDCDMAAEAGLVLQVDGTDSATVPVYIDASGLPSTTLTETSAAGRAALINVPAGGRTATVVHTATGRTIAELPILVRAGQTTGVVVGPTPLP